MREEKDRVGNGTGWYGAAFDNWKGRVESFFPHLPISLIHGHSWTCSHTSTHTNTHAHAHVHTHYSPHRLIPLLSVSCTQPCSGLFLCTPLFPAKVPWVRQDPPVRVTYDFGSMVMGWIYTGDCAEYVITNITSFLNTSFHITLYLP